MSFCLRCKSPLRHSESAFCPHCGASQSAGDTPSTEWQSRIDQHARDAGLGRRLLLLSCLLGPLTFPVFLANAMQRLRRHIAQQAVAPALTTPRFTAAAEGQAIARQLSGDARKGFLNLSVLALILLYGLMGLILGIIFIVPAMAPNPISYERALEYLVEASPVRYPRHWDGTEIAGVVMIIGLVLLHLLFAVCGALFWRLFMRHQRAEVLAACYARGDVKEHDRILPGMRLRHTLSAVALTILALTPIHTVIFPLLAAAAFAKHSRWEQRLAIPASLGIENSAHP